MAAYYVAGDGSNTSPYDTWAKAATSFATAVTAASTDGDIIYVDQGFSETNSADTVYTFQNNVQVICSNDKANAPPQTLGVMGSGNCIGGNVAYQITLSGAFTVYFYGMTFRVGLTLTDQLMINSTSGGHFTFERCRLWQNSTSISPNILIGPGTSGALAKSIFIDCDFVFNSAAQTISFYRYLELLGCTVSGAVLTTVFESNFNGSIVMADGCDFSSNATTLIVPASNGMTDAVFSNCKLGTGIALYSGSVPLLGGIECWNCAAGDQHYHVRHENKLGALVCDTGIYANDGASYDGTNRVSWKIVTTASASFNVPYQSPWVDVYHDGTSAITPYLEILRDGSATAFTDAEVWVEFSYQGTTGSTRATIVRDKKGLLASAANQTASSLGASDWTGENATAWFGKLAPNASFTPAEIGHIRARVCVGAASATVYVDPQIRGLS